MLQFFIQNFLKKISKKTIDQQNKSEIGRIGEDLAVNYLKRERKYKIITRNWTCNKDEIDIIARDGNVLVFLEVKSRTKENLVPIYYSVGKKKKVILERVCKEYLRNMNPKPRHFRFDIITVKFCQKEKNNIEHYMNVQLFQKNFIP